MEAVQKHNTPSIHIQNQIRHKAEDFKNALNELYNWEKEVKDKEQKLTGIETESKDEKPQPVRSHIAAMEALGVRRPEDITPEEELHKENMLADTFKERGNKHVKLGEFEEAISQYTAAIEAFDGDPKFYTNRALCYLKLKKYYDCIEDCSRAIEIDNLTVKAYYRRMQANECLGFNTQALKDCTTVLMIDSKNTDAKASLQRINQRLKKTGAVPKGFSTTETNSIKEGPDFSPLRSNMVDVKPIHKPAYARSKKPLKTVPIMDVVGPKDGKNFENSNIQISDEVIDKLFNGECGAYEEVKMKSSDKVKELEVERNNSPGKITKKPPKVSKLEKELISVTKDRPLPPPPTSTGQFYCNWKELSSAQKYQYLKSVNVSQLNRILGAGFDSEILTDLLMILKEYFVRNNDDAIEILLELSKHDRLPILSLLLSPDDKAALADVINYEGESSDNANRINIIKKSFNFELSAGHTLN